MFSRSVLCLVVFLQIPLLSSIAQPPQSDDSQASPQTDQSAVVKADNKPEFDDLSWLPKNETGVLEFLKQHPDADGRGVTVAIFDTGVDPGVAGLLTTPDGRPKVVDVIDGTGSGDVAMQAAVKADDGKLTGVTGRTLTIDPTWTNPSGEFRLGMKVGYELFPSELVSVVKPEREEKFRATQIEKKAQLQRKLADWQQAHPKPDAAQKAEKKELEARIALLDDLLKKYSDPGPIYDCVLFNDGERFQVVVDTDEDGDLTDERVMTNYRVAQQYATFADPVNLNFAVNVYDAGDVVSIVADTGAHGTHVAGIVAAYYPDQPEWNGVAPGAQIVSVKIGDTRLDGMESGPGLVRGIKAVIENDCDLINMSYGEPSSTPNYGRIAELYAELVDQQDVIFVSSAGNAGPALTTAGAPGGTTSALIGVGAYLSPEMMRSEYSVRELLPGLPYTWTSRGPTVDGDLGVDIFAPGGAIAPVPQWTRQASQQMNGTSMASPHACGNIALLLSAAKQQQVAYTPYSVRRAIQNTAEPLPGVDVFGAGPGLLQVVPAWDRLKAYATALPTHLHYDISVPSLNNARGIYLREQTQIDTPDVFRVSVSAKLKKEASIKQRLDISFSLKLESTADWVKCGDLLHLTHGGNRFNVEVDPTSLKPGVHFAEVLATDLAHPELGPIFRVPVTAIVPLGTKQGFESGTFSKTETFEPGIIERHFLIPPTGSTWAELEMTLLDTPQQKVFRVHTIQLIDGKHFEHEESGTYYPLLPNVPTVHSFPVIAGQMLELDLAQYWSILGDSKVKYELRFHGVKPDNQTVGLSTGTGVAAVTLSNHLNAEKIAPKGSLSTWRRMLAPKSAKIVPLSRDRDALPDGSSVYQLNLEYSLKMDSSGKVTLRLLPIEDLLYDAPIGPFVYQVFDKNHKLMTTNDMFPDPLSLAKGTFTVKVAIQSKSIDKLERYNKQLMTVDQSLGSPISLKLASSPAAAASGKFASQAGLLEPMESVTVYIAEPAMNSLPEALSPGDQLLGQITYAAADNAANKYYVTYTYSAPPKDSKSSAKTSSSKSLDEQIRELKLSHLKTLDPKSEAFTTLFNELTAAEPKDPAPYAVQLERLDTDEERKSRLPEVIAAADELIGLYDQNAIAIALGKRVPSDDAAAKKSHDDAEQQKKQLADALYRKARAIGYRELPDVVAETPIDDPAQQTAEYEAALQALETWVDLDEDEYFLLKVRQARREQHYAEAIAVLNKHINAESPLLYYKKRLDMLTEMEWNEWAEWQQKQMLIDFPNERPPYK